MKDRYYHFVTRAFGHTGILTISAKNLSDAILIVERSIPAFAGAFGCIGEILYLAPKEPDGQSKAIFATLLPGWSDHAAYEIGV